MLSASQALQSIPRLETGRSVGTDPGQQHLTAPSIPPALQCYRPIRPSIPVCDPWVGPWVGPWARRSSRRDTRGTALARRSWPWWSNLEGGKLPSVCSESEVHGHGTAHMYCTVTGIDFNSPHSHANGFPAQPAQHTGKQGCHHLSVTDGASHACSSKKKSIPSYPRFRLRHAQPTRGFAHRALRSLRPPDLLSQDSTAPHESVGQNTVSASARVETVLISAVLPRIRPSQLSESQTSGICVFVCVPIVDICSHGLSSRRECRPQRCRMAPRRHCGGWCAFHNRRRAPASSRNRNDSPPGPHHFRPESHRLPAAQKGPCLGPACVQSSRLTGSFVHVSVGRLRTVCRWNALWLMGGSYPD